MSNNPPVVILSWLTPPDILYFATFISVLPSRKRRTYKKYIYGNLDIALH